MSDPISPEPGDWVLWMWGDRPHLGRVAERLGRMGCLESPLYRAETYDRRGSLIANLKNVTAVIRCGEDGGVGGLRELLRHYHPSVRQMALRALADLGDDDG